MIHSRDLPQKARSRYYTDLINQEVTLKHLIEK